MSDNTATKTLPVPEMREEYERELESLDEDMKKLTDRLRDLLKLGEEIRDRVNEIAMRFPTEYDQERLVRSAIWYFKNVKHCKANERGDEFDDSECAVDGLSYIEECLQKVIGREQPFKVVDVLYDVGKTGIDISFTILESLGIWSLEMPFSVDRRNYLSGWHGKLYDDSPCPLQMSITYRSPLADNYIKTIMSGWNFYSLALKWASFDMQGHIKKQYFPHRIDEHGMVWEITHREKNIQCETMTDMNKDEWMDMVREAHCKMIPDWAR